MDISPSKQNNLISDVGMHRGEDTDYYLKKGFRVIAFEANPYLIKYCKENIESGKLVLVDLLTTLGYSDFQAVSQANVKRQQVPMNSSQGNYLDYTFKHGASGLFGTDLPNEWLSYESVLKQYKKIFVRYNLFGDYGMLRRNRVTNFMVKALFGFAIPGWYDAHHSDSNTRN